MSCWTLVAHLSRDQTKYNRYWFESSSLWYQWSPIWGSPSCWGQLWMLDSFASHFQSWKSDPALVIKSVTHERKHDKTAVKIDWWPNIVILATFWWQNGVWKISEFPNLVSPSTDSDAPWHSRWRSLQVEHKDVLRWKRSFKKNYEIVSQSINHWGRRSLQDVLRWKMLWLWNLHVYLYYTSSIYAGTSLVDV